MSHGKSFVSEELTQEERLYELERKYSILLEKIQTCDQIFIDSGNLKRELSSFKASLDGIYKDIVIFKDTFIKEVENTKSLLKESKDIFHKEIAEAYSKHSYTKNLLDSAIARFDKIHNDILEKMKRKADLVDDIFPIQAQLKDQKKEISCVRDEVEELHIQDVFDKIAIHSKLIEEIKKSLSVIDALSIQNHHQIDNEAKAHTDFQKIFFRVTRDIEVLDHRLKTIELRPELPALTQVAVSKNDLDKLTSKIELIALDASNAFMKAGNSSMQLSILEKKVESILLNLKKIELSK